VINPTTTFIDDHNTHFLTCLFGYHASVPGCELRVAGLKSGWMFRLITRNAQPVTRNDIAWHKKKLLVI